MVRRLRVLLVSVPALFVYCSLAGAQSTDDQIAIRGQVVNGQDLPVSAATVRAVPNPSAPICTDTSGKFKITVPASTATDGLLIVATKGSDRLGTFRILRQEEREPLVDLRIVLGETQPLDILVRDQNARPIPGATVGAVIDRVTFLTVKTGPLGLASLNVPHHADSLVIFAYLPGGGFDYRTIGALPRRANGNNRPADPPLTLTLGETVQMELRAKTEDGKPAVGLTFRPWRLQKPKESLLTLRLMPGIFSAVTDAQGIARFADLPKWAVTNPCSFCTDAVPRCFLWDPAKHRQLCLEAIIPQVVPMSGRVEFANGKPASGIPIEAIGSGDDTRPVQFRATSRADGRFKIEVLSDEVYVVRTNDQHWVASPLAGVIARPRKPIGNLTLTVQPATFVRGKVTVGNDHRPVADQAVSLEQHVQVLVKRADVPNPNQLQWPRYAQTTLRRWTLTDRVGRYQFPVGRGNYTLNGPTLRQPKEIEIKGDQEFVIDLASNVRGRGLLSGTVVDAKSGKPVRGATILGIYRVTRCADRGDLNLLTDDVGKFRVDRHMAPMTLFASSPDGKLAAVVNVGADDQTADIPLKPLGGARGQIVRAASGDPVANASVDYSIRVYMENGKMWRSSFGGLVLSRGKGRFDLPSLVADQKYEIVASSGGRRRSIGEVQVEPLGMTQIGKLKFPEPKRPNVNELIREAIAGDPQLRYKSAQHDAQAFRQRVAIFFIDPHSRPCQTIMELLGYDEIKAAMIDYAGPVIVDSTAEPGKDLAKSLGVSVSSGQALPCLVLRDAQGGPLAVYAKPELGVGGTVDKSRLVEVLEGNAPERLDTRKLLDGAMAQARKTNRRVLLLETTPASGPSHRLVHFLERNRPIWERAFILVRVDPRWNNSRVVLDRVRRSESDDVPWMAVLDGDAHVMITSNTEQGANIGFPEEQDEVEHFIKMLQTGSTGWTAADSRTLRAALKADQLH